MEEKEVWLIYIIDWYDEREFHGFFNTEEEAIQKVTPLLQKIMSFDDVIAGVQSVGGEIVQPLGKKGRCK